MSTRVTFLTWLFIHVLETEKYQALKTKAREEQMKRIGPGVVIGDRISGWLTTIVSDWIQEGRPDALEFYEDYCVEMAKQRLR